MPLLAMSVFDGQLHNPFKLTFFFPKPCLSTLQQYVCLELYAIRI